MALLWSHDDVPVLTVVSNDVEEVLRIMHLQAQTVHVRDNPILGGRWTIRPCHTAIHASSASCVVRGLSHRQRGEREHLKALGS